MLHEKPIIAITMGDPTGIGPEIIAAALGDLNIREICRPVVLGDPRAMARGIAVSGLPLRLEIVVELADAEGARRIRQELPHQPAEGCWLRDPESLHHVPQQDCVDVTPEQVGAVTDGHAEGLRKPPVPQVLMELLLQLRPPLFGEVLLSGGGLLLEMPEILSKAERVNDGLQSTPAHARGDLPGKQSGR